MSVFSQQETGEESSTDTGKLIGNLGRSRTLQSLCVCISSREMQRSAFPTPSENLCFMNQLTGLVCCTHFDKHHLRTCVHQPGEA